MRGVIFLSLLLVILLAPISAKAATECKSSSDCPADSVCRPSVVPGIALCSSKLSAPEVFGKIQPPQAIKDLGVGSIGLSKFSNNLITLLYIVATVVLVFMLLWGAFEWTISGGDKEKVASAQKRITNALIGVVLLGVAFAVIRVVSIFTGIPIFGSQTPAAQTRQDCFGNAGLNAFNDLSSCGDIAKQICANKNTPGFGAEFAEKCRQTGF